MASAAAGEDSMSGSIKAALEANLQLQSEIVQNIKRVSVRKAENRRSATRVGSSLEKWDEESGHLRDTFKVLDAATVRGRLKIMASHERERLGGYDGAHNFCSSDENRGNKRIKKSRVVHGKLLKSQQLSRTAGVWAYDDNRKWKLKFFVDPDGRMPKLNSEAARRRKFDGCLYSQLPQSLYPWSKEELRRLKECVEEVRAKQIRDFVRSADCRDRNEGKKTQDMTGDAKIDFEQVASLLKAKEVGAALRSAADCRAKFLTTVSSFVSHSKITKEESLKILQLAHLQNGFPPWDEVADALGNGRTPWQCYCHFRTKLESVRPWTLEEDELLFKYISAQGPQFLLNLTAATDLVLRFFPDRSAKQIIMRAHTSLLNPNLKNGAWNEEDERRLALCMRVHRDASKPIVKAYVSGHVWVV